MCFMQDGLTGLSFGAWSEPELAKRVGHVVDDRRPGRRRGEHGVP